MTIREGRWDCQSCGSTKILGRHKICPQCGFPRPEATRFYLLDDEPEVLDQPQLAAARSGPDWLCEFCGASNLADRSTCSQCNAARGTSPTQPVRDFQLHEVPHSGDATPQAIEVAAAQHFLTATSNTPRPRRQKSGYLKVLAAVALALVAGATIISWPRSREVTVHQVRWQRTIQVEQLRNVTEKGWSVPPAGKMVSQQPAVHHTNRVLDHYETRTRQVSERVQVGTEQYVSGRRDLGNGYFEDITSSRPVYEHKTRTETYQEPVYRQVPVFQTQTTYTIDRWLPLRVAKAEGADHEPHWPDVETTDTLRPGTRTEKYWGQFKDQRGKTYSLNLPQNRWRKLSVGSRQRLRLNALGQAAVID